MKITSILILLIIITGCQSSGLFKVETTERDLNMEYELKQLTNHNPSFLYSDSQYEVWKSCSGEWGGSVYFKNKENGKIYFAAANCPVSVNKIENVYYVSNSLSHLSGSSGILEIPDPKALKTTDRIPAFSTFNPHIDTREYETNSLKGTRKLITLKNTLIMSSFAYHHKLYSIVYDVLKSRATISEIKDGQLQTVYTFNKNIFDDDPVIMKYSDSHQKIFLRNTEHKGILEVKGNHIRLTFCKNNDRTIFRK